MDGVARWSRESRDPLATVFALTYDKDELIRWRAVAAAGVAAASVGEPEPEKVREFIRRLRWLMNDESGGVGWLAPEVMGEVILKVPVLAEEYAHLLIPLLREEPFIKGACLALARLARLVPGLVAENAALLVEHAKGTDPELRACALLALSAVNFKPGLEAGTEHLDDRSEVTLYDFDEGRLVSVNCGEIARRLLDSKGAGS
jgi:hypothetical protein